MVRPEHLAYFKDLLEGRAAVSWNAWFARNDADLSSELPRAAYLRLKFQKLDEAEKLLREAGVEYSPSPLARRERYYAALHPSVLDEAGRPSEAFLRRAYDGAFARFYDGEPEEGRRILAAYATRLKRRPIAKRVEALNDFCFDGVMQLHYGDAAIGRAILELVAAFETGDDRLDPAVVEARAALELHRQAGGAS